MTHNHNTRAKALVSGGCVISGEINFDYRTFFSKQWCIIPLCFIFYTNRLSSMKLLLSRVIKTETRPVRFIIISVYFTKYSGIALVILWIYPFHIESQLFCFENGRFSEGFNDRQKTCLLFKKMSHVSRVLKLFGRTLKNQSKTIQKAITDFFPAIWKLFAKGLQCVSK